MQHDANATAARSLTSRSKTTNDPHYLRGTRGRDGRTVQGRRRRDLVSIYLDALGGRAAVSELQLVGVRKAAELTTAAEAMRARVLAGDPAVNVDALVKLEGEARRAVRALGIKPQVRAHVPMRERLAAAGELP
jgi:hypothetical protein